MIKDCRYCGVKFSGNGKRKYCSPRCKKNYENSLRSSGADARAEQGSFWEPSDTICRPAGLNDVAAGFWDRVGPTLISRGHLNALSEHAFAELCDLYSRLHHINRAIDEIRTQAVRDPESNQGKDNMSEMANKLKDRVLPVLLTAWKDAQDRVRSESSARNIADMQAAERAYEEASSRSGTGESAVSANCAAGLYTDVPGKGIIESTLSELKRQYSKHFFEYCKEFHLTPRVNHGNYQLGDGDGNQGHNDSAFD